MARLQAIEKAGYFPCPTAVVKALVHHHIRLHPWAVAPTYILDPCAGEGSAVHTFAQALTSLPTSTMAAHYADMAAQCQRRIHVRAVELDAERAQAAKALLGEQNVLHSAIESVSAVGQFGIVWLNPPYDQVSGGRAELLWLRMCAPFVGESGMLVLIVPDMFVGTGRYTKEMTSALYQAGFGSSLVLRFPDPEYEPFKQVAILASRPVSSNNYAYRNIDLAVAGVIGQCNRTHTHIIRTYDTTPTLTRVIRAELRPSVFEAERPVAVMDLLGDPTGNSSALRPLAPMRSEHAAMVAAAGMFNGAVVGQKIIKGTTIKRVLKTTKHSETEAGTQVTEEIEAEVLAAQLATIDMRTAAIEVVNSMDHKERFEALLEAHAAEFVDLAKRLYPPVFTPDDMGRYEEALSHIHAPRVIKGQQNGMFPPQAFRAGAILDGWRRHKVVTMVGEMGVGKAQPLDAKVLTPTGWTTMGDIQVGEEVVNPAGGTARVIGVYPQGELPIYEIEFSDGSKTRCCDDHLWLVNSPLRKWRGRPNRVVPLWWIRMNLAHANGNFQHFVPMTQPIEFAQQELPLDPYLLGVLLGDGGLTQTTPIFSTTDGQLLDEVARLLPASVTPKFAGRCSFRLSTSSSSNRNPLTAILRTLGLLGKSSHTKFVPSIYKYGSVADRVALLQGLLDTDGYADRHHIEYCTVSPMLAEDMKEIVQSLGGRVSISTKTTYSGQAYRIYVVLPPDIAPFRLQRKAERYRPHTKYLPTRAITQVTYVGKFEAKCIALDSDNQLYLTDDYIVTHNTLCAMAACTVKALQRKPHNQKIVVLLPPKEDLVTKWAEEIRTALREHQPCVVQAQTISDVQAAFARDGLVFVLLKETTAKMSSGWAPVEPIRPRQRRRPKPGVILTGVRPPRCPACGQPILYDVDDPGKIKAHCQHCGTPMWTATRRKNGNGNGSGPGYARYPLARFIRDRYRDRYLLIIDEAHGFKSGDSARSYAAQDLLVSARCAIQMTGTLYNGMASSVYYLLWRALPEFRAAWGWSDVQRFINQYGLFEKITRTYRNRSSTSASGYENFTERKSERPGIHPAMIALLLPSTVFFGIRDLDVILPPYAEHTLFVPRPKELQAVERYLDEVRSDAVARMMDGDYRLMAQYTWANLGAWDVASDGDEVDGHSLPPIACPGDLWIKEEALLRLIAREKRAGRKVLCFVGQINRRDPTGRLCALLERYGMRGAVMRADEKQRVQFIRRALAGGADVVFTSAPLVKEGIDLLELPTLVWYTAEYNIYLVQQANRRSWRIGQTEDVHVYYLAYDRTPQAYAMHRIAKKLAAAQTLQGDVRQGLAALLGEEDFVSRLQDATIHNEHYESEMSIDNLPPLASFAPAVDVQVKVQTSGPARVRVTVQVEDLRQFQQLSLFG